jgi:hypothetical protein
MYEVDSVAESDDYMYQGSYWRVSLVQYQQRNAVMFPDKNIEIETEDIISSIETKFGDLIDLEMLSPNLIRKWEPNLSRKPSINKSLLAIYVTRHYGLNNESESWIDALSASKIHTGKRRKMTVYWYKCLILFRSLIQPYSNTPSALYNPLRKFLGPSIASRVMNIYAHFLAK